MREYMMRSREMSELLSNIERLQRNGNVRDNDEITHLMALRDQKVSKLLFLRITEIYHISFAMLCNRFVSKKILEVT